METCRLIVSRGQLAGALHSRQIEKSIVAAKKAKTRTRLRMLLYHATDAKVPQALGFTTKRNPRPVSWFHIDPSASNESMPINTPAPTVKGSIRKATAADLAIGLICADRDGNRIRIDHLNPAAELSYHFLNDELRVQEGMQEVSVEKFLAEGWYVAGSSGTL